MNVLVLRSCVDFSGCCSSSVSIPCCCCLVLYHHHHSSSSSNITGKSRSVLGVVCEEWTADKMLSSAMTRSLDFLVALFTDFSPIFGGPGGADESESPAERRSSRHQENWFLSRLQSTFSPNASPNRRRCNSDASACHILCLSQFYCHHFTFSQWD